MTSAVKVEGERLYRRAHRGEHVETPEREVEVYGAALLRREEDSAEFEIQCSTGTYVRTLIETLGDAYCEQLRRIAVGPFRVEDANGGAARGRGRARVPARADPGRGRGGARRAWGLGTGRRRGRGAAERSPTRGAWWPSPGAGTPRFGRKWCSHSGRRARVKGFAAGFR